MSRCSIKSTLIKSISENSKELIDSEEEILTSLIKIGAIQTVEQIFPLIQDNLTTEKTEELTQTAVNYFQPDVLKFLFEFKKQDPTLLLFKACQTENSANEQNADQVLNFLIKEGANINAKYKAEKTPLHTACFSKSQNALQIVEFLINNGADIIAKDKENQTPLHKACSSNGPDAPKIVEFLINKGANINAKDKENQTPLHKACQTGNPEIIKLLLDNDKNSLKSRDNYGNTPLHLACLKGNNIKSLEIISQYNPNYELTNQFQSSALHSACSSTGPDAPKIVKLLINKGADINAIDNKNQTPLHIACKTGNPEIIKLLLDNDKDSLKSRDDYGNTPLHLACFEGNNIESLEIISKYKPNYELTNQYQCSALHSACSSKTENAPKIVEFLINNGANINAKDNRNQTPLDLAKQAKNYAIVNLLKMHK